MRQPFEGHCRSLLSIEGLSHSEEPGCRDPEIRDDDRSVEGYSPSIRTLSGESKNRNFCS
jgi:hypothetical protein